MAVGLQDPADTYRAVQGYFLMRMLYIFNFMNTVPVEAFVLVTGGRSLYRVTWEGLQS